MPQTTFSKMLVSAVEESLSSLGDSPKQAILFHIENSFKIKKESIGDNVTEFTKALEGIFGPGASYLEKLILKNLCQKLGLEFENGNDLDFLQRVDSVKKSVMLQGEVLV